MRISAGWATPGFEDTRSRSASWARGTIYEEDEDEQCQCDTAMKPACVCTVVEAARVAREEVGGGGGLSTPVLIGIVAGICGFLGVAVTCLMVKKGCGRGGKQGPAAQGGHISSAPVGPTYPAPHAWQAGGQGAAAQVHLPGYQAAMPSGSGHGGGVVMGYPAAS